MQATGRPAPIAIPCGEWPYRDLRAQQKIRAFRACTSRVWRLGASGSQAHWRVVMSRRSKRPKGTGQGDRTQAQTRISTYCAYLGGWHKQPPYMKIRPPTCTSSGRDLDQRFARARMANSCELTCSPKPRSTLTQLAPRSARAQQKRACLWELPIRGHAPRQIGQGLHGATAVHVPRPRPRALVLGLALGPGRRRAGTGARAPAGASMECYS